MKSAYITPQLHIYKIKPNHVIATSLSGKSDDHNTIVDQLFYADDETDKVSDSSAIW